MAATRSCPASCTPTRFRRRTSRPTCRRTRPTTRRCSRGAVEAPLAACPAVTTSREHERPRSCFHERGRAGGAMAEALKISASGAERAALVLRGVRVLLQAHEVTARPRLALERLWLGAEPTGGAAIRLRPIRRHAEDGVRHVVDGGARLHRASAALVEGVILGEARDRHQPAMTRSITLRCASCRRRTWRLRSLSFVDAGEEPPSPLLLRPVPERLLLFRRDLPSLTQNPKDLLQHRLLVLGRGRPRDDQYTHCHRPPPPTLATDRTTSSWP